MATESNAECITTLVEEIQTDDCIEALQYFVRITCDLQYHKHRVQMFKVVVYFMRKVVLAPFLFKTLRVPLNFSNQRLMDWLPYSRL